MIVMLSCSGSLNAATFGQSDEALGTTENVAQKRVSRALHELGILLSRWVVANSKSQAAHLSK
jgi:hypothetical protein